MDANSTGLVIWEKAAVIIAEGLLSHYEGAKGRKSPSKGVETSEKKSVPGMARCDVASQVASLYSV
jgi:hypothetical protein